uniref:Putative monolaris n=1 Tax=Rhipicephalus pulchellus TaxID=72859 RepID=L7M946_RHIPC
MKQLQSALLVCFLAYLSFVDGRGRGGCSHKPIKGNCAQTHKSWYWDKDTNECKIMLLGSCPRNYNSYPTCEQCLNRCDPNINKKKKKKKENSTLSHQYNRKRCIMKA